MIFEPVHLTRVTLDQRIDLPEQPHVVTFQTASGSFSLFAAEVHSALEGLLGHLKIEPAHLHAGHPDRFDASKRED